MSLLLEPHCWATTAVSAISSFRQSTHLTFHVDQGSNFTMADRREFDLFPYIFNRDGEDDEPTTELQEDVALMNPTVKSDEDDASNSRAAVLKQGDQSRRAQPDQLQEPKSREENSTSSTTSSTGTERKMNHQQSRRMKTLPSSISLWTAMKTVPATRRLQ